MPLKKIWSQEEDTLLKKLYQENNVKNWSQVARKMATEYGLKRKSAKQCRQRYQNHINMETARIEWTQHQEEVLIDLHNQIGNKWSLIAQQIPGKTDNCVKNHFYSKLRKILRHLNSAIHTHFRRQFRQINIAIVYKIVEACEQRFKDDPNCQRQVSQACRDVQNKMLRLEVKDESEGQTSEMVEKCLETIKEIYRVSKMYKRKSKKSRNSSIQVPNLKKSHAAHHIKPPSERGYASDASSVFDDQAQPESPQQPQPQSPKIKEDDLYNEPDYIPAPIVIHHHHHHHKRENGQGHGTSSDPNRGVLVEQKQEGIRQILKDAGLLQVQHSDSNFRRLSFNAEKSSFKSYSDNNQSNHQFFQDSEIEKGYFKNNRKGSYFKKGIQDPSDKSEREGNQVW